MKAFKIDTVEHTGQNWLIANFGVDIEDNQEYILTTDRVHASQLPDLGGAKDQVTVVCALLNAAYDGRLQLTGVSPEEVYAFRNMRLLGCLTPPGTQ